MAFWGNEIIFDKKPSGFYNLYLTNPDGAMSETIGSSDISPVIQEISRRSTPYLLGVKFTPVLEFDINLYSPEEIDAKMEQLIIRWLTGHSQYKKLQIIQNDLADCYFNVLITSPTIINIGNIMRGIRFHVRCDSQWAWSFNYVIQKTLTSPPFGETVEFHNQTDQLQYLYPELEFEMTEDGGSAYIINSTDDSRTVAFDNLSPKEKIYMNNDLKIIKSYIKSKETGYYRVGNFNKKWLRLLPGKNVITVSGNVSNFKITYKVPRKVG